MRKAKNFDCVRMKDEIHEKLRQEEAGLTDEEIAQRRAQWIETSDDPLAQWFRRQRKGRATESPAGPSRR